jgi:hypothetical protein
MEVDGCREIGTELENFENIPFRGWIWSSTRADSPSVSSHLPIATSFTADIWLVVKVPVLSEQTTVVQPNVSTLGSFLTRAFFCAIFLVPSAKHVVITAGKPSGIAATASATVPLQSQSNMCTSQMRI